MRDFVKGASKFLGVVAILLLIVGAILYFFFVRVVTVGHNAMAPTVIMGDQVLVWRGQSFELGEMVLCPHPSEAGRYVIGRIVGRPGQTVSIERGNLRINGVTPDADIHTPIQFADMETGRNRTMLWGVEDILDREHYFFREQGRRPVEMRPHRVRGGVFLMSDNRSYRGEDSRTFGEVSEINCIGRVFMRLTAADSPEEIGNSALDILE